MFISWGEKPTGNGRLKIGWEKRQQPARGSCKEKESSSRDLMGGPSMGRDKDRDRAGPKESLP